MFALNNNSLIGEIVHLNVKVNTDTEHTLDFKTSSGDNGANQALPSEIMTITPDHPVYVEDKGWVWAENLAVGDRLRRADGGWAKVLAVERVRLEQPQDVYNFTVKGPHIYFVGDRQWLVHNACPLGRGSTGRATPSNLREQLAMEEVMSDPRGIDLPLMMNDSRWPAREGWVKRSQHVNGVEIHYLYNKNTGEYDDFKFADR